MIFTKRIFHRAVSILLFALCLIQIFPSGTAYADNPEDTATSDFVWPTGPSVQSDAAIVMEASTGLILYEKDIYTAYYPASITKTLTALLALENCPLTDIVTMSEAAEKNTYGSQIGLVAGEELTLNDAMYGMLLDSANEVSYAIGEHVAARVNSSEGSMEEFAAIMNARAKELGCVNSNFVNSHGLHEAEHYTCAYDMALIGKAAIAIPEFRTIAGSRTHVIPETNKNVKRYLAHHHRFINTTIDVPQYEYAIAGKTGATNEALSTLITFAEKDGMVLIAVVMHANTALQTYKDTIKILDFAFDNYSIYGIENTELDTKSEFPPLFSQVQSFSAGLNKLIRISENGNIILPNSVSYTDITKTVSFTPVKEFVHGDNVIGQISYLFSGRTVGLADILYYNPDYPITRAEFEAWWPFYLISPDVVFADGIPAVPDASATPDDAANTADTSKTGFFSKEFLIPLLVSIVVGFLVFIFTLYFVARFLRYQRKQKRRRRHSQSRRPNA